MKTTDEVKTGLLGESIACSFLESKGFSMIERNYRKIFGEIDVIAERDGVIHFVEVKAVSREAGKAGEMIGPAENIHDRKMRRVRNAAQAYIYGHKITGKWQIDALLIVLDRVAKTAKVELLENV